MDSTWNAITGNPLRFLTSSWPWRALAYLVTGMPGSVSVLIVTTLGRQMALMVALTTLLIIAGVLSGPIARFERWRLRLIGPVAPEGRTRRPRPIGPPVPKRRMSLTNPATWREIGYAFIWVSVLPTANGLVMVLAGTTMLSYVDTLRSRVTDMDPVVATPLTCGIVVAGLVGAAYLLTFVAAAQATLARSLLTAPLEERMVELTRSRARLVDAFEAERRIWQQAEKFEPIS